MYPSSFDLLWFFIVSSGLCPILGVSLCKTRSIAIANSLLHKRSGSIYSSLLILCGLSSFQAVSVRAWVISVQGSEHRHCKLAFTQTLRKYIFLSFDLMRSPIVLGGLCSNLGDLCARLGVSPLQYSPLHRRSGNMYPILFDLFLSFIVLGDLCARLGASPLQYSPLHKRSGNIYLISFDLL